MSDTDNGARGLPAPAKTGIWPWRKESLCYCMVCDDFNPHGWVRGFCPPEPAPRVIPTERNI